MRIERVTADTFSEASEQARQRYGSEALILSTNKVGNITELLVCVEAEDDGFVPAPGFREELSSQSPRHCLNERAARCPLRLQPSPLQMRLLQLLPWMVRP
jgi:flagellar biosynthesis GTPase FlhF